MSTILQLLATFSMLSFFAIGGANSVLPEMHRQAVDIHHWMSGSEFAALFALAQAAPGPNVLIVSLIGLHVAGLPGVVATTVAMCGPSSLLAYHIGKLWHRFRDAPLRGVILRGLTPITIGLVLGSGYLLTRSADQSWPAYVLTAVTVLLMIHTRLNPLWLLAGGAVLGLLGVV
ncbi:chromate transporter [Andreprevotia chitinilytica]|uniref:chromate transporter n=1 Tax=Andreprevotia chitinilytica TaxID=396808 RepID=UPI000551C65B|nr:chromate transporter [Andreprevotia chitinilytica]